MARRIGHASLIGGTGQVVMSRVSALEPLMSRGATIFLSLGSADCRVDDRLVGAAKAEITDRRRELAKHGVTWGYLLGVEPRGSQNAYRSAWHLCHVLEDDIARPIGTSYAAEFGFSFCKGYSGPVVNEASDIHDEGLHIDTHPALTEFVDLLRILINVDTCDRRFRFGDATRVELAASGLYPDRTSFRADHVQEHVAVREVSLPGRRGSHVSFLLFWASAIPHVGITESPGYFLYSFEAVAPSPPMGGG